MAMTYYLSLQKLLLWLLIFIPILTVGVTGQTVQLSEIQTVTECSQDLRDQEDIFTIIGEADALGVNIDGWNYIDFYVKKEGVDYTSVCFVDLLSCSTTPSSGCYCVEKGGDKYQVVMKQTATMDFSNAKIKLFWKGVESDVLQLPKVYGQNQESLTLMVNGENKNLNFTPCTFSLKKGQNDISYCCNNSPSPCTTKISYDGSNTAGDKCLQISVRETEVGMYRFLHAVCGRDSDDIGSCQATYDNDQEDTTVTKTTPEAAKSDSNCNGLSDMAIGLIAGCCSFVAIAVIVAVTCCCREKCKHELTVTSRMERSCLHKSIESIIQHNVNDTRESTHITAIKCETMTIKNKETKRRDGTIIRSQQMNSCMGSRHRANQYQMARDNCGSFGGNPLSIGNGSNC